MGEETGKRRVSDELLTVQEVSARLGVGEQAVRNWIARGEISAIKLGGPAGYRITPDDLDAFLMRRRLVAGFQRELEGRREDVP